MKKTVLLFLIFSPFLITSQNIDIEQFKNISVRNIGPAGMSGRVTAVDVDLSDRDHIYVGAASGGLWESTNGGISWTPIFDDQNVLSIGSIAICQSNPDLIWVGTGEGNPRNSMNSGAGIFRSMDGGKSWKYMGLKETKTIHRVIIHKDNPNIIYAGAMGSAWGPNEERGVYRSTDGGISWKKILYVNDRTGVAELRVDPSNPNKIFAAMWEYGRTPWDFNSGGKGSGLYISYDGGENWEKRTDKDGLPKGELGRIGIAVSPANPKIVYALIEAEKNALYKSEDGGKKFRQISTHDNIGNRPFYYYEIYADPKNENKLYSIWSYVSMSYDGGKTFEVIADYGNSVHPDHHAFWIHPEDPNYLIDGNDGGMTISRDGGKTWKFVSNLPVGQFYHVNVDNGFPYQVYGGMQDNGSWGGPGFVLKSGGIRNADWQELMFGDGFDVSPQPGNSRYGYAMSQEGNLGRWDRETGRTEDIRPVHPDGEKLRFNWNAAFAQNPFHDCGIYYGSQFLHKSMDCGKSWTIISPDLTTNDSLKQKQDKSGGLTIDATGAENHTTIISIAPSPVDENVIWVGTDDGNLQLTRDGGKSWSNLIEKLPGIPKNPWIPQIRSSTKNEGEAFVVINNYRQNDWSAYLYHTQDFGNNWKRLVDDNKVGGFVCSVLQDSEEPNLIFLGTDIGLYVSIDGAEHWNHWTEGMPPVQIRDMVIQGQLNDLVMATFGRAFWVMDDITPLRTLAKDRAKLLDKTFAVFDAADAYQVSTRSYNGIRFVAQGEFTGDNKFPGASFTIWKNPKGNEAKANGNSQKDSEDKASGDAAADDALKGEMAENKDKRAKPNELKIVIFNSDGDSIRTFTREIEEDGLHKISWNMRSDGVRFPSRREPRQNFGPPSGSQVMPGTYKAVLELNGEKDSTEIEVKLDPRLDISESDLHAKAKALEELNGLVKRATEAFDLIKEANQSLDLVDKMMVNLPDSTKKELQKLNKDQRKKLKELEGLYMMPEGLKGIQRNPNLLSGKLRNTMGYINSMWGEPSANAMNAFKLVKSQTDDVIAKVNEYIEGEWKDYREKVNAIDFSLFKEFKKVE